MTFQPFIITVYDEETGNDAGACVLNARCEPCDGSGIIADRETRTFTDCEACAGTGSRLTYSGQDLLRFIAAHQGHPDIENENLPL